MKKLSFALLALFLFAGCGKPNLPIGKTLVEGEKEFVFQISDQARSIHYKADAIVDALFELSLDGGTTWSEAGTMRGKGGWWGMYMDRGRLGRVKITAPRATVLLHNAITVGTPCSAKNDFGTSVSVACDAGVGSDRAFFGGVVTRGFDALATHTYKGNALTSISTMTGSIPQAFLGKYINSTTGSGTYAATIASGGSFSIGGVPMDGVDQTTPNDAAVTNSGVTNTPTVTVTSATGDLVLDVVGIEWTGATPTLTVDGSQTQRANVNTGPDLISIGMSTEAGASSVVMSWATTQISGTPDWRSIGININAAGGAAAPVVRRRVIP